MRVGTKFAAAALGSVLLVTTAACGSDTSSSDGSGARKSSLDIATVKADPAVEKLVPADVKESRQPDDGGGPALPADVVPG